MNLQLVPILGSCSCQHNQLLMIPQAKLVVFFSIKEKSQTEAPKLPPSQDIHSPYAQDPKGGPQMAPTVTRTAYMSMTAWWQLQASRSLCTSWQCPPSQHHLGSAYPHRGVGFVPSSPFLFCIGGFSKAMPSGPVHPVTELSLLTSEDRSSHWRESHFPLLS